MGLCLPRSGKTVSQHLARSTNDHHRRASKASLTAAPLITRTSFLADSVEKVASLKSLQICRNTNDIFD
jgi:hypothetical protein